jgi:hypothetical protein
MQQTTQTDLRTIRNALEANARLSSLSGGALMASGLLAFLAAGLTAQAGLAEPAARAGLAPGELWSMALLWGATLTAAVALNLWGMLRRARADGLALAARMGRRVLFAMLPALGMGGALTLVLALRGQLDLVFGVWMLCYGVALMAAGAYSLSAVRWLGLLCLLGGVAGVMPGLGLDFVLYVCTFGAGHFLLGAWVGVRHGW